MGNFRVKEEWARAAAEKPTAKCRLCRNHLDKSLFSRDKTRSSGVSSACKECSKEYQKRLWAGPTHRDKQAKREKEKRRYHRIKDTPRYRAKKMVRYALKVGVIEKPGHCCQCRKTFSPDQIHGHHHRGYDALHVLDVMWVCQRCHTELHR